MIIMELRVFSAIYLRWFHTYYTFQELNTHCCKDLTKEIKNSTFVKSLYESICSANPEWRHVQCTWCAHSDLILSICIVYFAPALNFLSANCAGCAHTDVRIAVQCTRCAHTDVLITVQCTQCAHLQYSVHKAPTLTHLLQYSAHKALTYPHWIIY